MAQWHRNIQDIITIIDDCIRAQQDEALTLRADYAGPVPAQMQLMDVPAGEYLVFEHGPFDFETQNAAVEAKVEQAMRDFDYAASGYRLDLTPGRVFYFYHDCARFVTYVRPVCRD